VQKCSRDQDKPEVPAAVEMDDLKNRGIFSMSRCESIHHTNSWRTSAGRIRINSTLKPKQTQQYAEP